MEVSIPHLIKKKLEIFIKNNHPISTYFFKNYRLNWEDFLNQIFLKLFEKCVPANIPVFLIKTKFIHLYPFLKLLNQIWNKSSKAY